MPSKNSRKSYHPDGYYHIYNRGVEKRKIFMDQLDYATFLKYCAEYLLKKDLESLFTALSNPAITTKEAQEISRLIRLKNFNDRLDLLVYCLMPNHYHLLVKQKDEKAMQEFTQACMTRYTGYFNMRHNRVGPLFQERYKAVAVDSEPQLIYLSWYIHRNSLDSERSDFSGSDISKLLLSQPSSYPVYIGKAKQEWVKPEEILRLFSKNNLDLGFNSYKSYVECSDHNLHTDIDPSNPLNMLLLDNM